MGEEGRGRGSRKRVCSERGGGEEGRGRRKRVCSERGAGREIEREPFLWQVRKTEKLKFCDELAD